MTTQYTPILKLALPVTGELDGTWGDVVNDNITSMVEQAVAGLATINSWTANSHTLTTANGTTSEARCAMLVAATGGGAPTAAAEIICPAASKLYILKNTTGYTVTLKTAAGSGVAVPAGDTAFLFCDGTNVNACITTVTFANGTANGVAYLNASKVLTSGSGLTFDGTALTMGANPTLSAGTANGILYLNGSKVATSGSALTFDGTNFTTTGYAAGNGLRSLGGNPVRFYNAANANWSQISAPAGTGDMQFDTGAGEQMRLTSTGLGIGTSSPGAKLDVNGTANISGGLTLSGGTANGILYLNGSKVATSGSALTFDGTNLGVGTSNPAAFGLVAVNGASASVNINATTGVAAFKLFEGAGTGRGSITSLNGSDGLAFLQGTTEAMRLTSTGLGIGTSSPAGTLDIRATSPFIRIQETGSGGDKRLELSVDSSGVATISAPQSAQSIAFSTVGSERMRLDSSGNLGIGTTSPGSKLHVNGAVRFGNGTALGLIDYSSTDIYFANLVTGGALTWYTNGAERMRLDASGNLGIGTSSPSFSLDVNGLVGVGTKTAAAGAGGNVRYRDDTGTFRWAAGILGSAGETAFGWYDAVAATERMRLDSSGNLGLGVTPSAWTSSAKAMELFGSGASLRGAIASSNNYPIGLSSNAYATSAGWAANYIASDYAALYAQRLGQHQWFNAPSGTAGNAITFTQAMTLDASGQLGIGATSPSATLHVTTGNATVGLFATSRASGGYIQYALGASGTSIGYMGAAGQISITGGTNDFCLRAENNLLFNSGGNTERARITAAGNQIDYQPAESAQNTSVTLTAANLQAQIITSNAAVTLTLPTGTSLEGYTTGMATDTAFEVTFIATTANAITIGANGNTTVGNLTVSGNTSGTFRFRKTATNTFTVYRIS